MSKQGRPSKLERKMRTVHYRAKMHAKESYIGAHTKEIILAQNDVIRLAMMLINLTRENRCTSKKIRQAEKDMQSLFAYLKQELKFIKNRSVKANATPAELAMNEGSADLIASELDKFIKAYSSKPGKKK